MKINRKRQFKHSAFILLNIVQVLYYLYGISNFQIQTQEQFENIQNIIITLKYLIAETLFIESKTQILYNKIFPFYF